MLLNDQPALEFGIISAGIIFTNTIMICLVFLPKVKDMPYHYKDKTYALPLQNIYMFPSMIYAKLMVYRGIQAEATLYTAVIIIELK